MKRADAGALLLDHRLEMNPRRRLEAGGLDRIEGVERADGAGLHVAGAAAIHLAVLDDRRERRRLPELERAGRDHVAMALQDQRFAALGGRAVGAHHRAGAGEVVLDRAEAAQILEVVDVDMPVVDLIAAFAQEIAHHVLARAFRAARRRDRDEVARGRKLSVEAAVDGVQNPLLRFGIHCGLLQSGIPGGDESAQASRFQLFG